MCLFLAALLLLGLFGVQAFLISPLVDLVRGLIGSGIFVLPFSLLAAFLILLFHDGRPVRLRVSCAWACPWAWASGHLFAATAEIEWGFPMVVELWKTGVEHTSAAVIAGFLAMLLRDCISLAGATVLTVVLMVVALLFTFRLTIPGLFRAYRERPRPEYEPAPAGARGPGQGAGRPCGGAADSEDRAGRSAIADFDIPVDEPVLPPPAERDRQEKEEGR